MEVRPYSCTMCSELSVFLILPTNEKQDKTLCNTQSDLLPNTNDFFSLKRYDKRFGRPQMTEL